MGVKPNYMIAFDQALNCFESATMAFEYLLGEIKIKVKCSKIPHLTLPEALKQSFPSFQEKNLVYRHVELYTDTFNTYKLETGTMALSHAHNWFLSDCLSRSMRKKLENTDEPFVHVVTDLKLYVSCLI